MSIEPTQEQIERAARAMCVCGELDPDEWWTTLAAEAEAALIAALNPPPEPDDAPTDRVAMEPWPYTGAAPGRAGE